MDNKAIFTPVRGQRMKLSGINNPIEGESVWTVQLDDQILWTPDSMKQNDWEFRLHGHVVDASFSTTLDGRLKNQRDAIDRLTNHLARHCPQLMGTGSCEHMPG